MRAGQELQDEVASDQVEEVETSDDFAEVATFESQKRPEDDVVAEDLDVSLTENGVEAATDPTVECRQVDGGQIDAADAYGSDDTSNGTEDEELDFDEEYGSATSRDDFGTDCNEAKTTAGGGSGAGSRASATGSATSRPGATATKEAAADHQTRRSRMLSYVARSGSRGDGDAAVASGTGDLSDQIDAAAMKAALTDSLCRSPHEGWLPPGGPLVITSVQKVR